MEAHDDSASSIRFIRVIQPTHFPIPPQPDPIPFRSFLGASSLRWSSLPLGSPNANCTRSQGFRRRRFSLSRIAGSRRFVGIEDNNIPIRDKDKLIPGLDKSNRCRNVKEVYKTRSGGYDGRCTVPMLWDSRKKYVLCNESYDIIVFFNSGLNEMARNPNLDLSPLELKGKIETWNQIVCPKVNNGVYR